MKDAKNVKNWAIFLTLVLAVLMAFSYAFNGTYVSHADEKQEIIYYDTSYGADIGSITIADYEVNCDSFVITEDVTYTNAPSYGMWSPEYDNYCGPLTGMNAVVFYDRWKTNLIPNFTPGFTFNDLYVYLPHTSTQETNAAFDSLYTLMKTGEVGGTTSLNFRNGLQQYMNNKGYNISYSSFYSGTKTIDLNDLKNAINQNKVGVIMCSEYNFVRSIVEYADQGRVKVIKDNSTIPHMMMVYGYKTYEYYEDGVNFRTDTFLYVTSSDGTGDSGYMQLNDFSDIDEAYIMTVS